MEVIHSRPLYLAKVDKELRGVPPENNVGALIDQSESLSLQGGLCGMMRNEAVNIRLP